MSTPTPGDRIRQARYALPRKFASRPISQEAVGLRCGWLNAPQSRVQTLEAGIATLTVAHCEILARALNVTPEWLAFGVGDGPHRDDLGAGNDAVRVDRFSPPGFRDPGGDSVGFDLGGAR